MAIPFNRKTFSDYCLRRLGSPVIDINVDSDQVDDRIDEALNKFHLFHYDGIEKLYMKHQITQDDVDSKVINLSELIIGVTRIVNIGSFNSSSSLFNVNYQFALNDLFNIQSTSMVPYFLAMQHISLINDFFSSQPAIRFNYHTNKLYFDDWTNVTVGNYIIVECQRILDPNVYTKIWSDLWLQNYATALIKKQWASNLGKFNLVLIGGVTYNGDKIMQEALEEIRQLEEDLVDTWSIPGTLFIG